MGGHGSLGSVSSSFMGVTLGYPSGHPDPHSSMIARDIESPSTAGSTVTDTTSTTTGLLARQPPVDIETAAATNPTIVISLLVRGCGLMKPTKIYQYPAEILLYLFQTWQLPPF